MSIPPKDIKLLWGRTANRCSICKVELAQDKKLTSESFPLGEQAHLVAKEPNGPRGISVLTDSERDSYYNLILLCPTHHRIIDENVQDFPVEKLHMIKADHELWVRHLLTSGEKLQSVTILTNQHALVQFVKEWLAFHAFFLIFHSILSVKLDAIISKQVGDYESELLKEWHGKVRILRELLFLVDEQQLIMKTIHDWEELKERDEYIRRRDYKTPFSYMLDFKAPVYAISQHGDSLWVANQISMEYLEYLSYKNDEIKQLIG